MSKPIPLSLGTVTAAIPEGIENDEAPSARWDRTERMQERIGWQITRQQHRTHGYIDYYQGRHIISRDGPIAEGVYLGTFQREAIVVSEVPLLHDCYFALLGKIRRDMSEEQVIRTIHTHVRETLPKGYDATNAVVHRNGVAADRKICLSVFITAKAGVCRHRALLAAYILERLVNEGLLLGHVSVDRNETDEGGHAWARFVSRKRTGCVWIIDAGLDVCGQLFVIKTEWSYARPTDKPPAPMLADHEPGDAQAVIAQEVPTPMTRTEFTVAVTVITLLAASYLWTHG